MRRIGEGRLAAAACVVACTVACLAVSPARAGIGGGREAIVAASVFPDEIRGTLTINGCLVDPVQVKIRATPFETMGVDGFTSPRRGSTIRAARVTATTDRRVLAFSIRGLAPRTGYQLGVSWPPNPCGKMFWRGPEQGLALSGARPVRIEGFAAQTQLELFSREAGGFVGAEELDFMDAGFSSRTLRWKSLIPGVTGGELQLSTEAFPHRGNFQTCDEPEKGVFYRQAVAAAPRGRWRELAPIDFGPLLAPPVRDAEPAPGLTPIGEAARALLLLGAPVYMRVVPIIGDAPACDVRQHGVAGWVVAAKLPQGDFDVPDTPPELPLLSALSGQVFAPPYIGQPLEGYPRLGQLAYRVIKPHTFPPKHPSKMSSLEYSWYSSQDPWGVMLLQWNYVTPGATWSSAPGKPTWFVYQPKNSGDSGNFVTDLASIGGGLVTGTYSALGSLVDYVAKMAEEIKTSVASAVVDVATLVPGVGAMCGALQSSPFNTSCEAVVTAGMEYGLMSMGVPPSLPNWQELQDQGIEYLAAEVATAIGDPTGLTAELTDQMLHDMVSNTLNRMTAARPGLGKKMEWLTPYLGYEPAVWTVSVFNWQPTTFFPHKTFIRVKTGSGLFQEVNVPVPERFPQGGVVRIPIVLQPSTAGIPAPLCGMDRHGKVECQPFWLTTVPLCRSEWQDANQVHQWSTPVPCDGGWNWPDIYYRDAWVQQKLFSNTCVTLGAYSAADVSGLWVTSPDPPFTAVAHLPPFLPAAWDGALFISPSCP